MNYEECVRDGALHWRATPDDKWNAYTAQALTAMLLKERSDAAPAIPEPAKEPTWNPFAPQPGCPWPRYDPVRTPDYQEAPYVRPFWLPTPSPSWNPNEIRCQGDTGPSRDFSRG